MNIPASMQAMVLEEPGRELQCREVPMPDCGPAQVLIRVETCGVCRTDLHVLDGDLTDPKLPLILGHEIVGTVVSVGDRAVGLEPGQKVGVPWLGSTCGSCTFCGRGRENLCGDAHFTGYHLDGGYAEWTVADQRFCFPIPPGYPSLQAAPLLCAGLIGYRSLTMIEDDAEHIGFYGFGAAAHILAQVARHQGRHVYAFTRAGDREGQQFARKLGASWAGDSTASPPRKLDAAIIFAPVGTLVPLALRATVRGGTVVCAGIHMSDIPRFPYALLWEERTLRSVANLTRKDGEEFMALAPKVPIHTTVCPYPLTRANDALRDLREGKLTGAAVLEVS